MWFLLLAISFLIACWILGTMYPRLNNFPPTYSALPDDKGWAVLSTMPDLRVSEFAPDESKARNTYEFRLVLEGTQAKVRKEKEQRDKLLESQRRSNEMRHLMYRDYYDKIQEIKARRWKEGNPVTKKNPIDPDEMPPTPTGTTINEIL